MSVCGTTRRFARRIARGGTDIPRRRHPEARGNAGGRPGLVPEVKGITDAKTIADWNQPFPMKLNLVTKRDEAYWDKYQATPEVVRVARDGTETVGEPLRHR